MAFSVGALIAKLQLDKKDWNTATKGVTKDTKTMGAAIQRNAKSFKTAGLAMTVAGGLIVGAIGKMVKNYVRAGDEVHKMALRTGFATETLSEYRYAAQIAGADISALEKGVKKMAKSIIDADSGLTTYQRSFDRIGVSYSALAKMSPEQQFEAIALAIGKVEDPTIRAASAQEIFGRAGTQLLPLFNEGAEGMARLRQEARDMGAVFDQEAANKAARLADAQVKLKTAMQGVTIAIAQHIVPAISKFVEGISSAVSKVSAFAKTHPGLISTLIKIAATFGGVMTALGPIVIILPRLVAGIAILKTGLMALMGPVGIVGAAIAALTVGFLKLKAATKAADEAEERSITQQNKLMAKLTEVRDAVGMTQIEFQEIGEKYDWSAARMAVAIQKGDEGIAMQKALNEIGEKRKAQLDLEISSQDGFNESLDDFASVLDEKVNPAIEETTEKTKTWIDFLNDKGIKTTEQKRQRVQELTRFIDELTVAYKEDKISLEDFEIAARDAKKEVEELSSSITQTAIPAARDMSGVFAQATGEIKSEAFGGAEAIKTNYNTIPPIMTTITSAVQGAWDGLFNKLKDGTLTFKSAWQTVWGGIKDTFFGVLQDMLTKWTTSFLTGLVKNAASAGSSITKTLGSSISGLGKTLGGLGEGIGKAVIAVAKGVAGAAKVIASAAPQILIAGAVAAAVYGMFKGVSALFKKKSDGGGAGDLHGIWENTKELRDIMFIDYRQILLRDMQDKFGVMINNQVTQSNIQQAIYNVSKKTADNTTKLANKIPKAAGGGYFPKESLAILGDKGPELAIPEKALSRLGNRTVQISMQTSIDMRGSQANNSPNQEQYIRQTVVPTILKDLRANLSKPEWQRALGLV